MKHHIQNPQSKPLSLTINIKSQPSRYADNCVYLTSVLQIIVRGIWPIFRDLLGSFSVCLENLKDQRISCMLFSNTCNICNMGVRNLTGMHTQSVRVADPRAYISGKSWAPMLQVTCITSSTLRITQTYSSLLCIFM